MTTLTLFPCVALLLGFFISPALAGECRHDPDPWCWRATHQAIYEQGNLIALLEANPQADDGYKAPIIADARADMWRLRSTLYRPEWSWTTPCCYSRPPIHIAARTHRRRSY